MIIHIIKQEIQKELQKQYPDASINHFGSDACYPGKNKNQVQTTAIQITQDTTTHVIALSLFGTDLYTRISSTHGPVHHNATPDPHHTNLNHPDSIQRVLEFVKTAVK